MNEAAIVEKTKGDEIAGERVRKKDFSPLFQPARVLVRFDDIAPIVEKPNHGVM